MTRNFSDTAVYPDDHLDRPRVRFNWGFHDATFDVEHKLDDRRNLKEGEKRRGGAGPLDRTTLLGKVYAAGYEAGQEAGQEAMKTAKKRPESSEPAWRKFMQLDEPIPSLTE